MENHLTADMTLATIALRGDPYATVLDRHGLDFCCGGGRTLGQACAERGLDVQPILAELQAGAVRSMSAVNGFDWNDRPLSDVIDFIVETHHAFTRVALGRIAALLAKVEAKHGDRHAELARVSSAFAELAAELGPHMIREERVLFPYMRALASPAGATPPPFGTVRNPVRMMMLEHDRAAELLAEIASATGSFTAPADACASYRALYAVLAELRLDLIKHVSLENNVLFPRAVALEDRAGRSGR